ncbi:MAG: hypothetical protein RIR87_1059 [Actinomycetota bacterium]|jgi:hypothetical protein|nr:hypothetical protein [Ilumatobacteraceae bacterium]
MFKVGSKLFLGLTGFSALTLVAYLVFVERLALGGVALSMVLATLIGLSAVVIIINDGDSEVQPRDVSLVRASMWPLVTVAGIVLLVLGLVVAQVYFIFGIVVVLAALTEWLVQSWSESASDDATHNESARRRVLHPIEFPVIATLGLGVIIFAFSRIMLAISKSAGAVAFIVLSSLVLLVGAIFAVRPALKSAIVGGICVVGAVGIIAGGIAGQGAGLRADLVEAAEEGHYVHRECGEEKSKYFDKKAMKTLSLRSNPVAIIELRDGVLSALMTGFNEPQQVVNVARGNPVTFIFRNFDDSERRMVASLGSAMAPGAEVVDNKDGHSNANETCTQLIPQGAEQALTVTYAKPSIAQDAPLTLTVPGVEGQAIEVVVP